MALSIFQTHAEDALKRLAGSEYSGRQERDALLSEIAGGQGLKAADILFMLFLPDRTVREVGERLLGSHRNGETVDLFLAECVDKPVAALRGAADSLFRLEIPGTEARLAHLARSSDKKVSRAALRLILEAPSSPSLAAVLWQLESKSKARDRRSIVNRLAEYKMDKKSILRWQRLARETDSTLREKALVVLASHAPKRTVKLSVEMLPEVSYATQQHLIGSLAQLAKTQGPDFADQILPLMASADAGTRSAVLKVLLAIDDRNEVIKRYLLFSQTLAGWARDRALDSIQAFGEDLIEPVIELLGDSNDDVRSLAVVVASSFEDKRAVPATIGLLKDPDWWIRITAADTLGRLGDPRAVPSLVESLCDPEVRWAAVEALGRIGDPMALPGLSRLLDDEAVDVRVETLFALSHFRDPKAEKLLRRVATSDPNRAVRFRATEMLESQAEAQNQHLEDGEKLKLAVAKIEVRKNAPALQGLLISARNQGASDLHLAVGEPPMIRLASKLVRGKSEPFSAEKTEHLLREILTDQQWQRLERDQYLDFAYRIPEGGRYRGNVFIDRQGYQGVFRIIPEVPPTIAEVGLPEYLSSIGDLNQGLVLVCGPSGSGKTTTVASLVSLINETRHGHILSLEDPVEFIYPFGSCLINQRQIGLHTDSFSRAVRAALREDPDVLVIGDMRDNETIRQALVAAETGHLVLGTMNSTSAPKVIDRIISSFPVNEQPQVRTSLSESLSYVIAQRLLPARGARRQVACFEILRGTLSVSNLIREEKTHQIVNVLQTGRSQGMQCFDDALRDLARQEKIDPETAYLAADKKEDFEALVSAEFLEGPTFV